MTPEQCRAGRALADWSREQLAEVSKVAHRTIVDFERGARSPRSATLEALQLALEEAGVVFEGFGQVADGGPGVRVEKVRAALIKFARVLRASPEPMADDITPSMRVPEGRFRSCEEVADEIEDLANSKATKAEKLKVWLALEPRIPNHLSPAFKRDIIEALTSS